MRRLERRVLKLNDEIARALERRQLVAEELQIHQHLNDDAQRDAAVSDSPLDRADARDTAGDVARFERSLAQVDARIARLEEKRQALLRRLG
jgi:hypothetical protein